MSKSAVAKPKPKHAAHAIKRGRVDATHIGRAKPALKVGEVSVGKAKTYSRAQLVGKFPNIEHRPAPSATRQLDDADRRELLQAMALS